LYGGTVGAFEFVESEGEGEWLYLVQYDDGDKEHIMDEKEFEVLNEFKSIDYNENIPIGYEDESIGAGDDESIGDDDRKPAASSQPSPKKRKLAIDQFVRFRIKSDL